MVKKANEQFKKELKEKRPELEPVQEYKGARIKMKFKCSKGHIFEATPTHILSRGDNCPYCSGRLPLKGFNTIGDLRPDLIKYFINPEDAFKYTLHSNKKVFLRCPDCGYQKELRIHVLTNYGFSCNKCSDNFSVPNKFCRNILSQLYRNNIIQDYDIEYTPNWVKEYKYSYDDMFIYNGRMFLAENHGIQHYEECHFWESLKEVQRRDKHKVKLAKENNIQLLVTDCRSSDFAFLQNNFVKTFNSLGIKLDIIDWNEVREKITENIIKEICELYEKRKPISLTQFSKEVKLCRETISKYLKQGTKLNWCDYEGIDISEIKRNLYERKILVYKDNKLIHIFSSKTLACEKMSQIYKEYFTLKSITRVLKKERKTYKGFIFRYIDEPLKSCNSET